MSSVVERICVSCNECNTLHFANGWFAKDISEGKRDPVLLANACHSCRRNAQQFLDRDISKAGYFDQYQRNCTHKEFQAWNAIMKEKKTKTQKWLEKGKPFASSVSHLVIKDE